MKKLELLRRSGNNFKMKKLSLILIFIVYLALPLISATDDELYIPCGGDSDLVFGCIGDLELNPQFSTIISGESNPKILEEELLRKIDLTRNQILLLIILCILIFCCIIFFIWFIIYKKTKQKQSN